MSKEKNLIPELRFPEFGKDGDWVKKSFDELFEIGSGKDYKHLGMGNIPVYGSGGYMLSVNDYLYDGESVCIGRKGTIDNPIFLSGKFWTVDTLFYTHSFKYCLPKYIYYTFQSINWLKHNEASGIPSLSKTNIYEIEILLPHQKEQQKIAACLSSLDELITAHNDKLETLKDHKKGLLQNLFPQEGENVPTYRFPEFENDGEWEINKFSNYIKLYRGSSPRPIKDYRTKSEDGVNWIKIGDTGSDDNFVISEVEEKITKKGAEKSRRVTRGELILANSMSYGKTYLLDLDGCIYDAWFVLREYEEAFDKQFLLQILNSGYMQYQYDKYSAGGIVKNISSKIVYNTILPRPSIKEQQQIASSLSALDNLIRAQSEIIEQLELHKKGLMQGLFPKNV